MENLTSVCKVIEDLLEILHSEGDSLEFVFCTTNESVNWDVKPHSLNFFELSLYKGKNTQVTTGGKSFLLDQNSITLFDLNKGINVKSSSGTYHYITFLLTNCHQDSDSCLRMKNICKVLERGIVEKDDSTLERQFHEIQWEYLLRKPYFKKRISLLIQDMFIQLLRLHKFSIDSIEGSKKRNYISLIDKVLLYLGNHYAESFNLKDIAAFTGYTQRYIDAIFKKATGYTIIQYLTKIRIESSKKTLLSSSMSITEIALECGFDSSSYFCKVFKNSTGLSPSEYRESLLD